MSLDEILAELRKEYLRGLPEKLSHIENLLKQGQTRAVESEFHKLKGTGKTYGLPEISELGEFMEHLLQNSPHDAAAAVPEALAVLHRIHKIRTAGDPFELEPDDGFQNLKRLIKSA